MPFLIKFVVQNSFMSLKLQFWTAATFKYDMKVQKDDQRSEWKTSVLLIA